MLSNMKLPIEVFTKWADEGRDEAMAKGHANSVNAMLDFTFKNIDNRFTFIDAGCGNGWVVRIVGDHPLCNKAIGVDGSKSMIEKAISIDKKNTYEYEDLIAVSYTHLRAHETLRYLVCRLLLEKKK